MLIAGPAGQLEVEYSVGITPVTAIFCHPHPLYQGTMQNKVVSAAIRVLKNLGLSTLRFNFRGVGLSSGHYADGIGEGEDLLAVISYMQALYPANKLLLGGFSFGGYIALKIASLVKVEAVVAVAPAITSFPPFIMPQCPVLLVQGQEDEIIAPNAIEQLAQQHANCQLKLIQGGHFLHGQLVVLQEIIKGFLLTLSFIDGKR